MQLRQNMQSTTSSTTANKQSEESHCRAADPHVALSGLDCKNLGSHQVSLRNTGRAMILMHIRVKCTEAAHFTACFLLKLQSRAACGACQAAQALMLIMLSLLSGYIVRFYISTVFLEAA